MIFQTTITHWVAIRSIFGKVHLKGIYTLQMISNQDNLAFYCRKTMKLRTVHFMDNATEILQVITNEILQCLLQDVTPVSPIFLFPPFHFVIP